jgi:threonine dehydrogenase-like Zn-dependent dehydrogenase
VLARAQACVPVPSDLPDEEAVFFNLAAIAMQGVRKARIELGEPVAVIGAGKAKRRAAGHHRGYR